MNVITTQITAQESVETLMNSSFVSLGKTYNEMLEQTVVEVNELERLKMNMKQLEDLHGRLSFTMNEVKSLMKRS